MKKINIIRIRTKYLFIFAVLFIVSLLFFSSCTERLKLSRDLTFTVGSEFTPRGDTCWFKAKPNMHVVIDSITANLKEVGYTYTVHNTDPNLIYYANQYFWIDWFNRVDRGQVWEFIFYGKFLFKGSQFEAKTPYVIQ